MHHPSIDLLLLIGYDEPQLWCPGSLQMLQPLVHLLDEILERQRVGMFRHVSVLHRSLCMQWLVDAANKYSRVIGADRLDDLFIAGDTVRRTHPLREPFAAKQFRSVQFKIRMPGNLKPKPPA